MTTRARTSPPPYEQLAARFGVVRRAWKRSAAFAGLAIVVTESIGIFTVLVFLDWLYQPQPLVRVAMWAVALAGLVYLLARHVMKPLLRKIPDEQIALYIEEHRTELGGILITAVEFGKNRTEKGGNQEALIDAVLHEAVTRSTRMTVGSMVAFSRLKKYFIGAGIAIAAYIFLSLAFPEAFSHRIGRVLEPWKPTEEDVIKRVAAAQKAEPLRFTLSKGDTNLARGTAFEFEVTLSKAKPANEPVTLFFRPKSGAKDWQKLPMTEIEKLNSFSGSLPDVTEDLEFYVACGADKSETSRLTVFDPLVVQGLEMVTHFPDYVHKTDLVEKPSTGDVTALEGSTATLRIVTSAQLKDGQIKWSTGETQNVTVDPQANTTATVALPVKADATYDYTVTDVNGQTATSPAPLSVHALPDHPPTLNLKSPDTMALTHPLGEIHFVVEADDDFGVEGMELVYSRLDATGKTMETRLPLAGQSNASKDSPHGVAGSYLLQLETLSPQAKPNDVISFHVEAKDAKGQKATTPIGMLVVGFFETWPTWNTVSGSSSGGGAAATMSLAELLNSIWTLDNKKPLLTPEQLQKEIKDLSGKMVDSSGAVKSFVDLSKMPKLAKVAPAIDSHVKAAHKALVASDTTTAVAEATAALGIYVGAGVDENAELIAKNSAAGGSAGSSLKTPELTMLEKARLDALKKDAADKNHSENDKSQAKTAAAASGQLQDVMKKQDDVISKSADAKSPASAGALAKTQQDLADKTRGVAAAVKAAAAGSAASGSSLANAAEKTANAAKLMDEAARAFAAGKGGEGHDKATQAKAALKAANDALNNTDHDKLETAISEAAKLATVLLEKQKELGTQTDATAKELAGKKPDQRQQRDLQKQAFQQTELGANAETLIAKVDELNQWAADGGKPDTIKALTDAQHAIKRGKLQSNMSGATVDLNSANPDSAATEQKDAEDCLQKVIAALQAGSDSLTANRESQLSKAARAAADAKGSIDKLLGKKPDAKNADGKSDQGKGADAKGADGKSDQGKGADAKGADGKSDQGKGADAKGADGKSDQGKGADAKGANGKSDQGKGADGKSDQGKSADGKGAEGKSDQGKAADAKGADGKSDQGKGAEAKGAEGKGEGNNNGGGDEVRKLAYTLTQLTTAVADRDLVSKEDIELLKQMTMDKAELEKRLATDPKFLEDVSVKITNIGDKLEAEMDAKTQASKLFSSQREECPPNYRPLVNKYFEVLSQEPGAAQSTTPPAPAAQP